MMTAAAMVPLRQICAGRPSSCSLGSMLLHYRRAKYMQQVRVGALVALLIVAVLGAGSVRRASTLGTRAAPCPNNVRPLRIEVWAFTAPWDPRSAASVSCVAPALRVLISGWLRLDTLTAMPVAVYPDTIKVPRGPRRFALITTYQRDRFHCETITRLAGDPVLRARAAGAVAAWAKDHGYQGLVLDFESLTPADTTALAVVVKAFVDSAHGRHVRPVSVAVVPTDTLVYAGRHSQPPTCYWRCCTTNTGQAGHPGPSPLPIGFARPLRFVWPKWAQHVWWRPCPPTATSGSTPRRQPC